ncbi:MAG: nitroreductase family protein [bacterium]
MQKEARTSVPINEFATKRWSPRSFLDKKVEAEKLTALFEAARWAASGGNIQPWRFIIGIRPDDTWKRIFEALNPGNQVWNEKIPVLIVAIGERYSGQDHIDSSVFQYDTGQAVANLSIEAMHQGLFVHQMGGFAPDKIHASFGVPENFLAITAIAVGYIGEPGALPEKLRNRELQERDRKPLTESVFSGTFGTPSDLFI